MSCLKRILMFCLAPIVCLAYTWSPIGPKEVSVNDYLSSMLGDVLCVDFGLLVYDWKANDWIKYSHNSMPALQAVDHDSAGFLLILSDSSRSDGIYKFNMQSREFELIRYAAYPSFLFYSYAAKKYYCGFGMGLLESKDGLEWYEVDYFKEMNCLAMAGQGDVLIVSEKKTIHFSYDLGKGWKAGESAPPAAPSLAWGEKNILYAIFPGQSKSSGLWSSGDSAQTWQVEFWSTDMSEVYFNRAYLFVGWEAPHGEYEGVAVWDWVTQKLFFMNKGLPSAGINRFSENRIIDCINIVACTDSGAYITCDIPISIAGGAQVPGDFILRQNYPNPFNPMTAISYSLFEISNVELNIYNLLGQKVATLVSARQPAGNYTVEWDASGMTSGLYLYKLTVGQNVSQTRKMVVLR